MIGDTRFHCGRDFEALVHTAEVEKGHVEMNSSGQMFQRLTETETQPRKAAKVRPHAEVRSFDMASADSFHLRVSADADWDGRRYFRRVVPLRAFAVPRAVEFEQLREVNVRAEVFFDGRNVAAKPVRRDLESSGDALAQILNEVIRTSTFALCDQIREDHFCFAVDCHPDVLVAPLFRNVAVQVGLFGVNEGPEFVGLNESRANIPNAGVEKTSGLLTNSEKQRKNRALVRLGDAGDSANAHSLKQERDDLCSLLSRNVVPSERLLARLGERGFAGGAAVPLDSISSVESEPLCFGVITTDAGHGLLFLCEKPYNQSLGFECGLRPRLNLRPVASLAAGDGALSFFQFSYGRDKLAKAPSQIHDTELVSCNKNSLSLVPNLFLSGRLDFSLSLQTRKHCVNRGEQVPVAASVKSNRFKLHAHFFDSDGSVSYSAECHADRVGQSEAGLYIDIFLPTELGQNRNALSQITYSLFEFLGACLSFAQLADSVCKFFLCFIKGRFVGLRRHIGRRIT